MRLEKIQIVFEWTTQTISHPDMRTRQQPQGKTWLPGSTGDGDRTFCRRMYTFSQRLNTKVGSGSSYPFLPRNTVHSTSLDHGRRSYDAAAFLRSIEVGYKSDSSPSTASLSSTVAG
jgi:hypothetical protein